MNNSIIVFSRRVCWAVALVAMFFQCYFPKLSSFIVPALMGYIIVNIYTIKVGEVKGWGRLFEIYILFLLLSMGFSLCIGRDIGHILRFSTILFMIPFVLLEKMDFFDYDWIIFKFIIGVKAITIICIWLIVFIKQDYVPWREWAYSLGVGDIYILYGIPRVQLQGNALLTFAAIADMESNNKFTPFNVLMLASVLCAGNSAFYLALFIYFAFKLFGRIITNASRNSKNGIIIVTILGVFSAIFMIYAFRQLEMKSTGVEDTNRVRIEQAELLLDTNPLVGKGIGAYANGKISTRTYVNATYFELQVLYVYYQIGLLGMIMFTILTYLPLMKNKKAILVYTIYLTYAFWNPYCFDSTHIMVLIIVSNIFFKVEEFESRSRINHCVLSQ